VANGALSGHWIKAEYNNQNSPSTFYTTGTLPPPVTAGIFYIHADHLNTPRVITNSASQLVW
jgi:hypothetical protein